MAQYHAPCFASPYLTMLLMPISLSTRNILANTSHPATYTISDPVDFVQSPMSQGRAAFIGVSLGRPLPYGPTNTERRTSPFSNSKTSQRTREDDLSSVTHGTIPTRNHGCHISRDIHSTPFGHASSRAISTMSAVLESEQGLSSSLPCGTDLHSTHYIGHIPIDVYTKAGEGLDVNAGWGKGLAIQA